MQGREIWERLGNFTFSRKSGGFPCLQDAHKLNSHFVASLRCILYSDLTPQTKRLPLFIKILQTPSDFEYSWSTIRSKLIIRPYILYCIRLGVWGACTPMNLAPSTLSRQWPILDIHLYCSPHLKKPMGWSYLRPSITTIKLVYWRGGRKHGRSAISRNVASTNLVANSKNLNFAVSFLIFICRMGYSLLIVYAGTREWWY